MAQYREFTVTPKQPQAELSKTCSKRWFNISISCKTTLKEKERELFAIRKQTTANQFKGQSGHIQMRRKETTETKWGEG